ncbi:choline ABC transporter permease [Desulfosarcina alkanivorans]|jgi:osmoprotectant transport system permease protein|uniref:Choline ABC transporter permease n=1 Tax=Desulfosarcina alkanivorans TaxID=571177 RepID=A0A5K7YKK5_9BACT|nr:ABC transporter permease [Desulfosarcina alkanivorans]BBO69358.1 choline ABC transporter permease [Desulfosarcina alkanivorans]
MEEIIRYLGSNYPTIIKLTMEHLYLVSISVGVAILTGVPLGILITRDKKLADAVLYVASVIITIPSVAMFGLMIPLLSLVNRGIGFWPAAIAIFLYSQLPIIRNTYTAINNIDPALREAAKGMGMSDWQRLARVEIPLAVPVIMAGVRMAVVMNIAVATIAVYIGAGGLGTIINEGITGTDGTKLIVGAVAVSLLAIIADYLFLFIQKLLTPKGLSEATP